MNITLLKFIKPSFNSRCKMMLFIFILVINAGLVKAQSKDGIKFESELTWAQVKDKAKKENKYIFVDGFTTWCVPCKVMANEVFPQSKVGDFFNKNFINAAVQFNATKKDNKDVRKWYKDAKYFSDTYKIDTYPTYLFFNPDGELVHKIIGSSQNADEFIAKAKMALSPETQYNTLKQEYESGKRDTAFLLSLINAAQFSNNTRSLPSYVNDFLITQKNLLTQRNLNFIINSTIKTTDAGFSVLLNNPDKVDEIGGKGKASEIETNILFDEIVLPSIRTNGTKTNYGGGMIVYSGEIVKNVDWDNIKAKLDLKYLSLSQKIIMYAKPIYYQWLNDWPEYTQAVTLYISNFEDKLSYDKIITYAFTILANCPDIQSINSALTWSQKTLNDKQSIKPVYLYTYADLLYKAGKKDQSIQFLKDAINTSGDTNKLLGGLLNKISNNEKTW